MQLEKYGKYIVYSLVIALHAGGRTSDCVVVLCDVGGRENFSDMVYNEINGNCKKYIVTTKNNNENKNDNRGKEYQADYLFKVCLSLVIKSGKRIWKRERIYKYICN